MDAILPQIGFGGKPSLRQTASTVQMVIRSSSRLAVVGLVGLYGTFAIAGYGVSNRLLLIALIPCFGLGNAASTLVGQNLGARKPERAERNAWWVSTYAASYMAVVVTFLLTFASPLVGLFDSTPQVVTLGSECLRIVALSLIFDSVGVVLGRGFDGAGDTVPAMAVNLFTLWGVEVAFSIGLAQWLGMGITGIWWGRAIANMANGLFFAVWFRLGRWKRRKV